MRFVVWRIARALVFAAILALVLRACSAIPTEEGKHYDIDRAKVDIELQDDGSLVVREALTFDFSGTFSGAYREFPLNGDARVTDIGVSEGRAGFEPGANTALGSFGFPETFGFEELPGGKNQTFGTEGGRGRNFRVVWHYRAADEKRTFLITYRVINATDVRDDIVDVTWTPWGDQWDFHLDELETTISAASGAAPTAAWVRPRSLGGELHVDAVAAASIDRVGDHEAVGFRAVFDRDAIDTTTGTQVRSGAGLAEIEAAEASLDAKSGIWDDLLNFVALDVLLICLIIGGLAVAAVALIYWLARDARTDTPTYLPEPPEQIPPALAYAIATEGEYDNDVVLATLLDLVDRDFYESRTAPGKDLDLELRRPGDRPSPELAPYETAALDFFDKLIDAEWTALSKLSEKIPEHSSSWRSRWEGLNEALDRAESGQIAWDRDLRPARAWIAWGAFMLLLGVLVAYFVRTGLWVTPAAAILTTQLLIFALPGSWARRLKPEDRQRNARWRAFRKWTDDFPRLDDDPPATLDLWRRILVYAVAFGSADRVAKSGHIPAPVAEQASSQGLWVAGVLHGDGLGSVGLNSFSSSFASQVAPESSSGGGAAVAAVAASAAVGAAALGRPNRRV